MLEALEGGSGMNSAFLSFALTQLLYFHYSDQQYTAGVQHVPPSQSDSMEDRHHQKNLILSNFHHLISIPAGQESSKPRD